MNRRTFIQAGVAAAATIAAEQGRSFAASTPPPPTSVSPRPARIDANVTLFQWPGRRLPHDDPASLQRKLQAHGITQAWAGSFEGLLQRDLAAVNARLDDACRTSSGRLVGFGSVNPTLPGWEDDLRRCHETHHMPGIRLHPNYHGYQLADPRFKRLLGLAAERRLVVQIACLMEDTRTQNPLLSVPDVDVAPLADAMAAVPTARVLLLNSGKFVEAASFDRLKRLPGVFVDTARVESVGGVGRVIRRLPAGRVVFGSHFPFFIYEAAVIKIFESALSADEVRSLTDENPRALLKA